MTLGKIGLVAAAALIAGAAHAQDNPQVGGADMFADRTIVENAVNSPVHTTLVAAVQQAGLVDTLNSAGPFTVFAPTDDAFGMLSDDSLSALMMDENREQLAQILTCHVVATNALSDAIAGMIADDGGMHPVPTVGGCTLQARMSGGTITLTDENGREATVTVADVRQSNGVIHVIDRVLLPAGQAG
ncbi:fasciclin domain-containing protein [Roseivivax isoporae]|uniref:Fasciclin n=1 Tax=Roseivivax isoporae LMG 25204 TaxID=1449351 RepID=X7FAU2_9RHOB|nr:fasciclin domain-containing protein [Roseivivax isoporae]ETX29231.1 fasciclin [Roseivivax isoporae LMG 25204]